MHSKSFVNYKERKNYQALPLINAETQPFHVGLLPLQRSLRELKSGVLSQTLPSELCSAGYPLPMGASSVITMAPSVKWGES